MKLHEDCKDKCQYITQCPRLAAVLGIGECVDECEWQRAEEEDSYWRNMSWQERQGWMRARDEECD